MTLQIDVFYKKLFVSAMFLLFGVGTIFAQYTEIDDPMDNLNFQIRGTRYLDTSFESDEITYRLYDLTKYESVSVPISFWDINDGGEIISSTDKTITVKWNPSLDGPVLRVVDCNYTSPALSYETYVTTSSIVGVEEKNIEYNDGHACNYEIKNKIEDSSYQYSFNYENGDGNNSPWAITNGTIAIEALGSDNVTVVWDIPEMENSIGEISCKLRLRKTTFDPGEYLYETLRKEVVINLVYSLDLTGEEMMYIYDTAGNQTQAYPSN